MTRKPLRAGMVIQPDQEGWRVTVLSPGDGAGRAKSYDLETLLTQEQAEQKILEWAKLMALREPARFRKLASKLEWMRAGL